MEIRHEILTKFKAGEYNTLVASNVLNEGVDVPAASIAIILSGTGSTREYIQRLGRILRKGNLANKQAILYEVIAEDTSEERTSARRRGENNTQEEKPKKANLQVIYGQGKKSDLKAAEQLEINYSTKKKDVTNRPTDTPPKRRGNYSEETET